MDNGQINRDIAKAASALSRFGQAVSQTAKTIAPVMNRFVKAHFELEDALARSRRGKDLGQ